MRRPSPRALVAAPLLAASLLALVPVHPAGAATVPWRPWSRAAFEQAHRERRLVLLEIGSTWSHACHVVEKTVWGDSTVTAAVDSYYVAIRADGDRRPDIADRYLAGGWPTTAILTSDGQVLISQDVIDPRAVRSMLREMHALYAENRIDIERRAAQSARLVERTWRSDSLVAPDMPFEEWYRKNLDAVRQAEDATNGGFGAAPKLPQFESIRFLLAAAATRNDRDARDLGLRTLRAALHLEDRLWGGFFRFAGDADWKRPHTEKLLTGNADALQALIAAVDVGGGPAFRDAALRTEGFATTFLWDPARGGWWESQDADLLHRSGGEPPLTGEVYYGLGDKLRREQGIPSVDSLFLADGNARMASAILRGERSGLWKGAATARALRALDRLWAVQRAPDGAFYHAWERGRATLPGLLSDQAYAGLALLDAYETTKDRKYRTRAETVARWIRDHLEDPVGGGFRYGVRDTTAVGRLRAGDKPEGANVAAATFFARLYQLSGRDEDRRSADRALAWLRSGDVLVLDPARAELGLRLVTIEESEPAKR
ncbi:MAG: DUF255 domain-containing protein [Hyphomicrobiales bacterium]